MKLGEEREGEGIIPASLIIFCPTIALIYICLSALPLIALYVALSLAFWRYLLPDHFFKKTVSHYRISILVSNIAHQFILHFIEPSQ